MARFLWTKLANSKRSPTSLHRCSSKQILRLLCSSPTHDLLFGRLLAESMMGLDRKEATIVQSLLFMLRKTPFWTNNGMHMQAVYLRTARVRHSQSLATMSFLSLADASV